MKDKTNFLENVRIGNLLQVKNYKIYVNEDMLSTLQRNGYEWPNVKGYLINDYGVKNLVGKNKLLDDDYVNKFVYVHELQNAYFDSYKEELFV